MTRKKRKLSYVEDPKNNQVDEQQGHHHHRSCHNHQVGKDEGGMGRGEGRRDILASSLVVPPMTTRDTNKLYASYETIACALNEGCVPCAYKIGCFDVALDQEFCQTCPNQRPEQCPRAQQPSKKHNSSGRRILGLDPGMSILTVGDGDFSFSLGLARHLLHMASLSPSQEAVGSSINGENSTSKTWIVATSYEKKSTLRDVYPSFDTTIQELESLGVVVAYEVDATRIAETMPPLPSGHPNQFHRIIWNFPCTAIAKGQDGQNKEMEANKRLVQRFVESARSFLTGLGDGELYMCHKTKPPFNQWNLENVALSMQQPYPDKTDVHRIPPLLCYSGRVVLDRFLLPPYTPRKALDRKSFSCHDACFYIFAQEPEQGEILPSSPRLLFPSTIPTNTDEALWHEDLLKLSSTGGALIKVSADLIQTIRHKHMQAKSVMPLGSDGTSGLCEKKLKRRYADW
jgi:25S rRNA (uracil2634-N3)-methyltransferase